MPRTDYAPAVAVQPAAQARPIRRGWVFLTTIAAVVLAAGVGGWYWSAHRASPAAAAESPRADPDKPGVRAVSVEVVRATAGGIDRVCVQPGSLEPFEAADLYAKVSGFLAEQSVDLGSRVKAGQVLARIAVPEAERAAERDAAKVQHAQAAVKQMQARIVAAGAEAKSAEAAVAVAKLQVRAKDSYRRFREKQLTRLRELNAQRAIDAKVVDESEEQYEASVEAAAAATEAVAAAEQRLIASRARIDQADADLDEARAGVAVAAAEWERSKVLVAYSVVGSPYDGVVTKRSFNRGDFVRSADSGGDRVPLFSVERTDKMRVVVAVPDRDVPYTDAGDAATVEIDALPGEPIKSVVARVADSEDAATRTMRTEIDLPNPDGKLRRGMYGRVTITLQSAGAGAITVPTGAVFGKSEAGKAAVRVVRAGVVRVVPVVVGADDGIRTEVRSGLTASDDVVTRASAPVSDGTPVTVAGR